LGAQGADVGATTAACAEGRSVCKIAGVLRKPDMPWALLVAAVLVTLYGATLCPTVYWYDSAELAACARSLGVPHPPGYPLYMLLAHGFTWLPGEPALGVNLMSLGFGVASALLCFVLGRQLGAGPAGAATAALSFGVSKTVWWNSVVAEVYMPGLTFTLGVLVLLLRAVERRSVRLVWAAALVGGLGVGVHMSIATLGLGYLVLVVTFADEIDAPRALLTCWKQGWPARLRALGGSVIATATGLLVFAYVPLRVSEPGAAIDWARARQTIAGGKFGALFMQDYDMGKQLGQLYHAFADNLSLVGLAFGVLGLVVAWRRSPRVAVALGLGGAGNVWFFFNYYVPDIDVFFLPAMAITAVLLGVGLDAVGEWLVVRRFPRGLMIVAMLALPVVQAVRHYEDCDLSNATEARDYAQRLIAEVPEGAQIVVYDPPFEWKLSAVLMYVQRGLGRRDDIRWVRRPTLEALEARVAQGDVLYVLVPLARIVKRPGLRLVEDGVLWRIRSKGSPSQLAE
jgi:Protein of unknown function (DUF2723)